jgi:superfamily I DNA/RNA helicase
MLKPTNEQENILNARGRIVKINARAGTGKTATLLMIARKNQDKRILYLVFNSRNRQEAKTKFPDNVEIHTIHSFALSASGGNFDGFDAVRPSHYLSHFRARKETLATLTSEFIVFFLNSAYRRPDEAIDPFKQQLSDELREIFTRFQGDIREISRTSLNSWYKTRKGCPHDFYLKLSHLENKFQNKLAKYDLVLVDEGQDLSPIMIDALSTYRGCIVIVGDSHQQIYSFRYAEDAMQNFTHDELHELTLSFRFGDKIAALTREFINNGKGDHDFAMTGTPEIKSQVYLYEDMKSIELRPETAILCRTNFSLFKNAISLKARNRSFCFERDISGDLFRTLDVYWLSISEKDKIKDDLIRSFESVKELEKYAETISDFQLQKIVELVNVYRKEFPDIVFDFLKRCQERKANQDRHAITLATIHAAKGQEYEHVIIDEDIVSRLEGLNNGGTYNYFEEINVAYVGMTRAKNTLYLPAELKRLFTREWQDYTSKIPVINQRDVRRREPPIKKPTVSMHQGGSHRQANDLDRYPSKKAESRNTIPELKVGDTVRTSNGYGQIVKIDKDQYLISMENQKAKIWERRSALVKIQKLPPYRG